jgi:hypothetical protein
VTEEILYQKVREGLKERPVLRIDAGGRIRSAADSARAAKRVRARGGSLRSALRHRIP